MLDTVTGVSITGEASRMVQVYDEIGLTAVVTPPGAINGTVTWTGFNAYVEAVGGTTGNTVTIRAVAEGEASITATAGGHSATVEITVYDPDTVVHVTSVTIQGDRTHLIEEDEEITLTAEVYPANATHSAITWTGFNAYVEVVGATTGNSVTIRGAATGGSANITATAGATGNQRSDYVTVTVYDPAHDIPPTSVTIQGGPTAPIEIGTLIVLTATVYPPEATIRVVTWDGYSGNMTREAAASDDTQYMVRLRATEAGSFTITASAGGVTSDPGVAVTVNAPVIGPGPVQSVTIGAGPRAVDVGNTITLTAAVYPAGSGAVSWSSGDAEVATVNATTGVVTGVSAGTAQITATAGDQSDYVTITVNAAAEVPESIFRWVASDMGIVPPNPGTLPGNVTVANAATAAFGSNGANHAINGINWTRITGSASGINNERLNMLAGIISLGMVTPGTGATSGTNAPAGRFDLTSPVVVYVDFHSPSTAGNFQIQVNNNTGTGANSIHGAPVAGSNTAEVPDGPPVMGRPETGSRPFSAALGTLAQHPNVIVAPVGTTPGTLRIPIQPRTTGTLEQLENSVISLRIDGGGTLQITRIEVRQAPPTAGINITMPQFINAAPNAVIESHEFSLLTGSSINVADGFTGEVRWYIDGARITTANTLALNASTIGTYLGRRYLTMVAIVDNVAHSRRIALMVNP